MKKGLTKTRSGTVAALDIGSTKICCFIAHASDAVAAKRRRYAEAGAALVPLALEARGRPSDEAAAFVRLCGSCYAETHRIEGGDPAPSATGRLWQELSTLLQLGNAELILSASGR